MSLDKYYYSKKSQALLGAIDEKNIVCLGAITQEGERPYWLFGYKLRDELDYCPTMSGLRFHKADNLKPSLKEFVERGYCFGFDYYMLIQTEIDVWFYFKPAKNKSQKELTIEELQIILSKEL